MNNLWQWCIGVIVLSTYSCNCVTVIPEFLKPCMSNETKCVADAWTNSVQYLAAGRPELNIPKLDPLRIESFDVDIPGMANIKFNGTIKGIRKCIFDNSEARFKKGHVSQVLDLRCNITIKGRYNIIVNSSSLFGNLGSNGIDGLIKANGDGKVKLEKLNMKMLMEFKIIRDEDNEIKLVLKDGPIGCKYNIGGPVVFTGSKIFIGDQDISTLVIGFVNQNWQVVMNIFGGPFFVKAMEIMGDIVRGFFKIVPLRGFYTDDLEQYAPNPK